MGALSALTYPEFLPLAIGLAIVLGACVGSFITLITYRLPLDETIGATRSRCPQCSTILRIRDLVPVLSWALHRGRCRHCKHPIGIRYPLTEVACATGAAFLVAQFHVTWEMIALCGLWWCIVAIFVTDLEHYIILDEVQIAAALFGLLYGWATGVAWDDMLGAAFTGIAIGLTLKYGFIYFRNKDGLGMGDVKFLGVAGIWLAQWMDFVPFLFFSGVLGIVSGIGWTLLGRGERFPFGPALAVALFICVVFPHIADNFWNLYGAIQN